MKAPPCISAAFLLACALLMPSCSRSPRIADQGKADHAAVDRLIEAAAGARPQGKVVLVLPAAVEYQGLASEQMSGRFRANWKNSSAPLVEFRLARSTDSTIRENPAEFRRFAAMVGTLTAGDVAALQTAHPDARLFVSFCGLPLAWNADPGGPKWVAYCPPARRAARNSPARAPWSRLCNPARPRPRGRGRFRHLLFLRDPRHPLHPGLTVKHLPVLFLLAAPRGPGRGHARRPRFQRVVRRGFSRRGKGGMAGRHPRPRHGRDAHRRGRHQQRPGDEL
ncbi:MAG: hypothetical protein U1G05_17395 [Kiritimatiellia bacterium]